MWKLHFSAIQHMIFQPQIEVCTVYDCLKSDRTVGTTAEAVPQGMVAPVLWVLSTSSIRIAWRSPTAANGVILRYDLMRKARLPCGQT